MATKTRKTRKKAAPSTGGGSRTKRAKASAAEDGGDPIAERIEKSVEERLAKMETRMERRKKSSGKAERRKKSTGKADVEDFEPVDDDLEDEEDSGVSVRKLRRSAMEDESEPAPWEEEDFDEDFRTSGRPEKGFFEEILSFLPGSKARKYDDMIDKLERMDEFGKAPDLDPRLEAFMEFLYKRYWRVETAGLENIPNEGRTLIVANHSGVLPFDGAMMAIAILKYHPANRYARFLIEDWFGQLPFATEFMNAVGQVRGCQENADRLLRQEELVGVFPEGIKGMAKGFKDRYNLARFGRGGVIRLAIRTRSPVVPCAVVGAEEIYVVLGYANWLGKMLGMPLFPITATFPWLGPLGLVPLPTKWSIQFGDMISYDEYDDSALKDNVIINRLNRQLRATIQEMLDSMLKKRRSLFFG